MAILDRGSERVPDRGRRSSLGTLVLRPVEGEDICIELCPGYASGQAAQDELRRRIGEVVGDAEESQEIFDSTTFVMPDLIEMRSTPVASHRMRTEEDIQVAFD